MHFSGTGHEDWGANFGTTLGCTDVSAFDGISFFAKGTSRTDDVLQVIAQVPAAHPAGSGGDCLENCWSHPRAPITLTEGWGHYTLPFGDLRHPGLAPVEGVDRLVDGGDDLGVVAVEGGSVGPQGLDPGCKVGHLVTLPPRHPSRARASRSRSVWAAR